MANAESRLKESTPSLKKGLYIPLKDIFVDTFRTDSYPASEKATKIFTQIFDCIPPELLKRAEIRGSTSLYGVLQQQGVHRRGTISAAFMTLLDQEIQQAQSLPETAKALSNMEFGPNIDISFAGADRIEFETISQKIQALISKEMSRFPQKKIIGPNSPLSKERGVSSRRVVTRFLRSQTPGHIDNMFVDVDSIGKETADTVPLGHLYFAADYTTYSQEDTFETRRDPKHALSWDLCTGTIEKHGTEYFIVYDENNIKKIMSPMKIGPEFSSLPASQRFLLLLRAAQKGATAEDNLKQSSKGRRALHLGNGRAPAIDPFHVQRLKNEISPEELQSELATMSAEKRSGFESYVRQYMLTGLFYPHKFNEYCRELGVYRFFPNLNLDDEQSKKLGMYMEKRMPQENYEKRLYESTHPYDAWYLNRLWRLGIFDIRHTTHGYQFYEQLQKFVNPFELFLLGLKKTNGSNIINPTNSIFFELNKLLQLSPSSDPLPEDSHTPLIPLRSDTELQKIFEFDMSKYEYGIAALVGLAESLALIIPALTLPPTSTFNSFDYLCGLHAFGKILMAFVGFSGYQAIQIALGKYSLETHQKEAGKKG